MVNLIKFSSSKYALRKKKAADPDVGRRLSPSGTRWLQGDSILPRRTFLRQALRKQRRLLRMAIAGRGILTVGGVDGSAVSRHLWRACVRADWLSVDHRSRREAPYVVLRITDAGRAAVAGGQE